MTHEQIEQLRDIARAAQQRIATPRHCGPGVPAPCGCTWESGAWDVCDAHRVPHSQHVTSSPACDICKEPPAEAIYEDLGDCDDSYVAELWRERL